VIGHANGHYGAGSDVFCLRLVAGGAMREREL